MSTTTRTRLLLSAAAAALALAGAAVEAAAAADSVERATKLLQGKRLTVYIAYENRTDSDIEHRIDFCPRGRAFVKSTYYWIAPVVRRGRGHWRVVSADIHRGFGWAKVRFRPGTQTAKVVIDPRRVRFLGHRGELTPSPRCSAGSEPVASE